MSFLERQNKASPVSNSYFLYVLLFPNMCLMRCTALNISRLCPKGEHYKYHSTVIHPSALSNEEQEDFSGIFKKPLKVYFTLID